MVQIIFVYSVQIETKKYDPEASYVLDLIFEISIHVTSKEITTGKSHVTHVHSSNEFLV